MPNWCMCDVKIVGEKEEIKNLSSHMLKAVEGKENPAWIGHYLEYLNNKDMDVKSRGFIESQQAEEDSITLYVECAWSPCLQPICLMVEKYAPNSVVEYYAEEVGEGIYIANNGYVGDVVVDIWGEDNTEFTKTPLCEMIYNDKYYDLEDFVKFIEQISDCEINNIEEAFDWIQGFVNTFNEENDTDVNVSCYQIEYVDIEETF